MTALGTRTTWVGGALLTVGLLLAGCGSGTGTAAGPGSSGGAGSPTPPPGQPQRVLELASVGGFAGPAATALRPPKLVVYSDGMVVLDGARVAKVGADQVQTLTAAVAKDLAGQPETLTSRHVAPDAPATVMGVRQPGGSYQKVQASGLIQAPDNGLPAPVLDAYTRIDTFLKAADGGSTTPYTSQKVRLGFQCSGETGKPWPSGLPQPVSSGQGSCGETQAVAGSAADVVKADCGAYGSAIAPPQLTAYQSDQGARTCQWRYDLPDE